MLLYRKKFNSRFEFLRWTIDWFKWQLGLYRKAQNIDFKRVSRVIFVCKGNICRSAYAHVFGQQENLNNLVKIDSCGVETTAGKLADKDAIRISAERGRNLTTHTTQSITQITFSQNDLILYMEPSHKTTLQHKLGKIDSQQSFLSLWANHTAYLPDPYGGTDTGFRECFTVIEKAITALTQEIQDQQLK